MNKKLACFVGLVAPLLYCAGAETVWAEVPDWVVYPEREWKVLKPRQAGIDDVAAWNRWVVETNKRAKGANFQGEDHRGNKWGAVITRGGYLIQSFGDPDYKFQTASAAKAFVRACLQLAIDKGLIKDGNELIRDYWTGKNELNSRHKYLSEGHHVYLTFNHLANHTGAFPITNGHSWKLVGKNYDQPPPPWAECTKDPDYDNYAHVKPGPASKQYSSGGYWRLAQALTALWGKDLKQVLDENLFTYMGIDPGDWDWLPGQVVHDSKDLYPRMPDYGLFVDPPYRINGNVVRTGGTGIVMSAQDLARYGLLVATGGQWKGRQLISSVVAAGGGNGSSARGYGGEIIGARAEVTTTMKGIQVPWELFVSLPSSSNAETSANVRLFEWGKGIGVESHLQQGMTVFLWFYEWNMFDARRRGAHTAGSHAFEREVSPDGSLAVIRAPDMTLTMNAAPDGADLLLEIKNQTDHDWPAIAGIIPCFNPGAPKGQAKRFPIAKLNRQFDNRNTWYVARHGLARLEKREIHFNDHLDRPIRAAAVDGKYPFSLKWPTSEQNAHLGLMIRESTDGKWVTGIAWDQFLSAQGHNPWQCMHLCVNVGPLKRGDSKTIRGRIYLFQGTKEECLRRYRDSNPRTASTDFGS